MDPFKTIILALEMYLDNNFVGAMEHIKYYKEWRERKGFKPMVSSHPYFRSITKNIFGQSLNDADHTIAMLEEKIRKINGGA